MDFIKNYYRIRAFLDSGINYLGSKEANKAINDMFSRSITYIVTHKFDPITAKEWENSLKSVNCYPKFNDIQNFSKSRSFNIENKNLQLNINIKK